MRVHTVNPSHRHPSPLASTPAYTMEQAEDAARVVTTLDGTHDLVWIVGPGDLNEELRHSLRSADVHVPHRRVWVAGHVPPWLSDDVGRLPVEQVHGRHRNSTLNLLAACESGEVSDPFVWMHDDMFALRPITRLPLVNKNTMSAFADHLASRYNRSYRYLNGLRDTRDLLVGLGYDDPVSYEIHVPLLVHKEPMREAISIALDSGIDAPHKRSIYGALVYDRDDSVRVDDPKIAFSSQPMNWPDTWVSTSDQSWPGRTGDRLRRTFVNSCRYEAVR